MLSTFTRTVPSSVYGPLFDAASVVLPVPYHMREIKICYIQINVDDKNLSVMPQTMHMGTMRSANRSTQESAVQVNMKKGRRII